VKWSWLLVLGVVVALSLDYHWRRLPTTAAGYFSRGRADYLLGDYESAIGNLSRSIQLAPGDAEAYIWRGEAYAKLDELRLAMPDLAKALQLRPDYDKAHAAMADGLAAAWDTEGAIAEYSAAIAIEPNYGRCYLERGKMFFDAGRWDEAATDFRRAGVLLIRENQFTAQLLLWTARARAGDAKGATGELTRVVKSGRMKTNRFWNAVHFLAGEVSEKEYLEATASAASDDIGVDGAEAFSWRRPSASCRGIDRARFRSCVRFWNRRTSIRTPTDGRARRFPTFWPGSSRCAWTTLVAESSTWRPRPAWRSRP